MRKLRAASVLIFAVCGFLSAFPLPADEGTQPAARDGAIPETSGAETETGKQQPGEEFFSELEQVLNMNIAARISEAGEDALWNVESSKCTVSGRSVSVKLMGKNIIVLADFTPYVDEDDSIVLVARGQVWISSPTDEPLQYLSTLKSIPVRMGERVLFFPLGVKSLGAASDHTYNIELEIQVVPRAVASGKGEGSR
ncbi:MAG: hypothetical protein LBT68_00040 [Spirochaetales bacterium]|jgi:hypothetical protein|nr:hypothetical protein [Spirochaetales bacterium]